MCSAFKHPAGDRERLQLALRSLAALWKQQPAATGLLLAPSVDRLARSPADLRPILEAADTTGMALGVVDLPRAPSMQDMSQPVKPMN